MLPLYRWLHQQHHFTLRASTLPFSDIMTFWSDPHLSCFKGLLPCHVWSPQVLCCLKNSNCSKTPVASAPLLQTHQTGSEVSFHVFWSAHSPGFNDNTCDITMYLIIPILSAYNNSSIDKTVKLHSPLWKLNTPSCKLILIVFNTSTILETNLVF